MPRLASVLVNFPGSRITRCAVRPTEGRAESEPLTGVTYTVTERDAFTH